MGTLCLILISITIFMLIMLNCFTLPVSLIVWKFLNNRCGDDFETQVQFEVEFSDQESSDDFDVDAEDPELSKIEYYSKTFDIPPEKGKKNNGKSNKSKKDTKDT